MMKTKTTRKNKFLATLLLIAVLLTTLPTSAFAGTITKGNQTLSIKKYNLKRKRRLEKR